jgi:hypothetical protein
MPLDFPISPNVNDTYMYGGNIWVWNGFAWAIQSTSIGSTGGYAFTESSTAPASPNPGDRWYHTDDGIIYTSVTKNGSQVWIG